MNFRDGRYEVPSGKSSVPLDRALRAHFPGASWSSLRRLIETGKVRVNDSLITSPTHSVRAGDVLLLCMSAPRAGGSASLAREAIVFVDAHVVVAEKPAGMMSVPFEDERDTFADRVRRALERRAGHPLPPLGIVHRIDKETSGLLVFTRRPSAKRSLEQQFRLHSIERVYRALVHGRLTSQTFRSRLVADRGDGRRGSTRNPKLGRESVTHVTALEALNGATLVECRLETGRTHQIRIHLSEAGHPLIGERVYVRGPPPSPIVAPRLMLHAATLGFDHPASGRSVRFESPLPEDIKAVWAALTA